MSTLIRAARHAALATAVAVAAGVACADDIDIFATVPTDNDLPNVMILWDNSANWGANIPVAACSYDDGSGSPKPDSPNKEQGTKMAIEKCAILNVIHALPTNPDGSARFNVALMLFNESPSQNSGGYPRMRFLPMSAANKTTLKAAIRGISINGDKGNNAAFTKSLHEAYLMFSKAAPLKGTAGTKWDPLAVAGGQYVGPPGSGCGRNHIIFVANGGAGEVTDNEAMALLSAAGGNVTPLVYPTALITNSDQGNWADEYARFLNGVDIVGAKEGVQSVTTHAIAVTGSSSDGKYPNFMRAIATQGGGQYYSASDITQLTKYLINIFNSIQATNSVFASASLPISASSQGSYKNQVFVGVFRPDEEARPRWVGNLKQYKIGYDRATDTMQLVDAEGSAALNSATGFFRPSAVSFWTKDSTFWINDPIGTPESITDLPDGEVVEKGGVAQGLRTLYATSQDDRTVLTCVSCSFGTALSTAAGARFKVANTVITKEKLGAATDAERDALIAWIRGNDNNFDEKGPGGTTTVRPGVHGDVLHSRPAVVDYGGAIGTIVFYGSNDGFVRAIDGNQTGDTAGQELWAFVPEEFLGRFKRLRDNTPEIRFPSTPASAGRVAARLLRRRPGHRVPEVQRRDGGREGVAVRVDATRRPHPLRVRRDQPVRAEADVAAHEHRHPGPRADVVGAARRAREGLPVARARARRGLRRGRRGRAARGVRDHDGQRRAGARRGERHADQEVRHGAQRRRLGRAARHGLRRHHRPRVRGRHRRVGLPDRLRDRGRRRRDQRLEDLELRAARRRRGPQVPARAGRRAHQRVHRRDDRQRQPRAAARDRDDGPLLHAVRPRRAQGHDPVAGHRRQHSPAAQRRLHGDRDHAGLLHGARPRREGRHVGGDDRRQHLLQHQPADAAGAEQLQHQPRRREGLPDPAVLRPSRLDRVRGRRTPAFAGDRRGRR
jgi:hypothetical protein